MEDFGKVEGLPGVAVAVAVVVVFCLFCVFELVRVFFSATTLVSFVIIIT